MSRFVSLFFVLIFFNNIVFAKSNVDVVTTVAVNMINMNLNLVENMSDNTGRRDKTTRPELQGTEVGVTLIDNDWYYGFNTQITGQSTSRFTDDRNDAKEVTVDLNTRSSFSIYIGHSIIDQLSIYGGLTRGTSSYGDKVSTKENGPFIGLRYGKGLTATSSLSVDFSYSTLKTEFEIKDDTYKNSGNADGHNTSANSSGFALSLTWLKALDRGRSFFVRLKTSDITIGNGSSSVTGGVTANLSGNQKLTAISFGVAF